MELNRNKLYNIGKEPTFILKAYNKIDNTIIDSLEVYKIFRRKNKIFIWAYEGKGELIFKDENYSKKYYNLMKDHLKNENLC
jgi:hypothetical protein